MLGVLPPAGRSRSHRLNKFFKTLLARERPPLTRGDVVKHGLRVSTVAAKASFWALCYHYFGPGALLNVIAAWTLLLGIKDLTFARVRLANMVRPRKRRSAVAKSVLIEAAQVISRAMLILLTAAIVVRFDPTVAALISGLILCAILWARETMITLATAYRVTKLPKYASFAAAVSGLAAVVVLGGREMGAIEATVGALIVREGVLFLGLAIIALVGRTTTLFRTADGATSDDEDDDGGSTVGVIGSDGKAIQSTFKIFIADNVVYSRWRVMQFGSRMVAGGLFGPFGNMASRLFFSYRRPGDYVHKDEQPAAWKTLLPLLMLLMMLGAGAMLAERMGLLEAFGIAVAAFAFRIIALSINMMAWSRLKGLVGQDGSPFRIRKRSKVA